MDKNKHKIQILKKPVNELEVYGPMKDKIF